MKDEKATFYRFLMVAITDLDVLDPYPYDTNSAFFFLRVVSRRIFTDNVFQ